MPVRYSGEQRWEWGGSPGLRALARRSVGVSSARLGVLLVLAAHGCRWAAEEAPAPPPAHAFETDAAELRDLKHIPHVPVHEGVQGYGGASFFVTTRTSQMKQYPCSACHLGPLAAPVDGEVDRREMHVDIPSDHASKETMSCRTCHDAGGMDGLRLFDGTSVSFDHAYRLCAQCHFEQVTDWAGGAHGKRLAGWKGKRVVMNCAECHDPHAPGWDVRWPVAHPRIPRRGDGAL